MAPTVVNQWSLTAENNYGLLAGAIAPTPGNTLIAFAGWNAAEVNPVANFSDDANDWWYHLGTSPAAGNVRCSVWAAPNIRSGPYGAGASIISLALSWFSLGLAGLVVEFSGLPKYVFPDFAGSTFNNAGTSLNVGATATVLDDQFVVCVSGNNTATVTPSAGWNALTVVSVNDPGGAGGPGDCRITPLWLQAGPGATSNTFTASTAIPLAGAIVGFPDAPVAPVHLNPAWPVLRAEIAPGYQPGDPTQMAAYTDITKRMFNQAGQVALKSARGTEYELSQPQAGEFGMAWDNHDGAFTPGNQTTIGTPYVVAAASVSTSTTTVMSVTGATRQGDRVMVAIGLPAGTALLVASVTDSQGNSYSQIPGAATSTEPTTCWLAAPGALPLATTDTVTVTWFGTGAAVSKNIVVLGCAGLVPGVPVVDKVVAANGSSTAPAATSGTLAQQNELAIFVVSNDNAGGVPSFGGTIFTPLQTEHNGTNQYLTVAYSVTTTIGGLTGLGIITSAPWSALMVTFKQAILLGTPIRAYAIWNDVTYPLGGGFIERMPQQFVDNFPQYGMVPVLATDGIAALSNCRLPSAYSGEVLIDNPYAYFLCNENYPAGTTGNSGAQGLPLNNTARSNQKPAICMNGVGRSGSYPGSTGFVYHYLETGLQVNMPGHPGTTTYKAGPVEVYGGVVHRLQIKQTTPAQPGFILTGDPGTGIGISANTVHNNNASPGAIYIDPDMPNIETIGVSGITLEAWAILPTTLNSGDVTSLISIRGKANNYLNQPFGYRDMRVMLTYNQAATSFVTVWLADFAGNQDTVSHNVTLNDGILHHYALVLTPSLGRYSYVLYLDGVAVLSGTNPTAGQSNDWTMLAIGPAMSPDGSTYYGFNYTIAHAALYGAALPAARIAAHRSAGALAWSGDTVPLRSARLMTWGAFGLARSGDLGSPSPLLGPADQIQGQSVAQALNDAVMAEGGMVYADAQNNTTIRSRAALYNRKPKFVLGDREDLGEIPYRPTVQFGYDNSFVWNLWQVARAPSSSANTVNTTVADAASEQRYFTRAGQAITTETTSDQDSADLANWLAQHYNDPELRIQQVQLNPAAHTAIWPAALGLEQGDVVQVNRRPLGSAPLKSLYLIKKIEHNVGPGTWLVTLSMVPYSLEATVLTLDTAGYDVAGTNNLGW